MAAGDCVLFAAKSIIAPLAAFVLLLGMFLHG
jgi:hypothetical protein